MSLSPGRYSPLTVLILWAWPIERGLELGVEVAHAGDAAVHRREHLDVGHRVEPAEIFGMNCVQSSMTLARQSSALDADDEGEVVPRLGLGHLGRRRRRSWSMPSLIAWAVVTMALSLPWR